MIFLVLSIVAAIVLVGLVIRRLPYLRTHRPGLEITIPRPYIGSTSWWQTAWFRVVESWLTFRRQTTFKITRPVLPQLPRRSPPTEGPDALVQTARPGDQFGDEELAPETLSQPAHPFWTEEAQADPLELPSKGLVTRRGEAQKIAHELMTQADAAFRKQDYKEAEKFYLQAASKDLDNSRIYNRLGVIYLRTKNYRDAIEAFRGSIKFDDRVASRHYNLALAYLGKKDYRSAEMAVREAIKLEPTNDKYRQTLQALEQ